MKKEINWIISLIALVIVTFSCKQPPDEECTDPEQEWPFPANAARWFLSPFKIGDSIRFNVYHKIKPSSPYLFLRNENYFIKDTMLKKIEEKNYHTQNCNSWMFSDYLVADIIGPNALTCELDNQVNTALIITFLQKKFTVSTIEYAKQPFAWHDSINIGNQKYYNVQNFGGVDLGPYHRNDSTYCYYNQEHGLLKFIINDTLIYLRNLK